MAWFTKIISPIKSANNLVVVLNATVFTVVPVSWLNIDPQPNEVPSSSVIPLSSIQHLGHETARTSGLQIDIVIQKKHEKNQNQTLTFKKKNTGAFLFVLLLLFFNHLTSSLLTAWTESAVCRRLPGSWRWSGCRRVTGDARSSGPRSCCCSHSWCGYSSACCSSGQRYSHI